MFQRLNSTIFLSALVVAGAGCGSTAVTEITGPDTVRCQTTVAAPQGPLAAGGGQLTMAVVAARECSWTAGTDAAWMGVTPTSGQGEGTLTVTVAENPSATSRAATLILNDSRLSVAQEAAACRFSLSGSSASVPHTGGSAAVGLSTLDGCNWRVASSSPWIRAVEASGRNSATVRFEVEPNLGNARRGDVDVAGLVFSIQQDGAPVEPPPAPPTPPTTPPPTTPPPTTPPPTTPPPTTPPPTTPPPTTPPPTTPPPTTPPPTTPPPTTPPPTTPPPSPPVLPPLPPPLGEKTDVKGNVGNLSGSCPNLSFKVRGTTIRTDSATDYKHGTCASIKNGEKVDVKGREQLDGSVYAEEIKVDK